MTCFGHCQWEITNAAVKTLKMPRLNQIKIQLFLNRCFSALFLSSFLRSLPKNPRSWQWLRSWNHAQDIVPLKNPKKLGCTERLNGQMQAEF